MTTRLRAAQRAARRLAAAPTVVAMDNHAAAARRTLEPAVQARLGAGRCAQEPACMLPTTSQP